MGLIHRKFRQELGLYTDPYQYFGMLGNEMHRAVRLVVDTGYTVKDGPESKLFNFQWQMRPSEAAITTEIERYMAIPGQALSYKIGQLKIMELRQKHKTKWEKV
jgi:uncharacterized protein (DUF885 family)